MRIKQFLKKIALKALGYNPVIGAGIAYNFGRAFGWLSGNGITGYDNKIVYAGLNLKIKKLVEPDIIVARVKNTRKLKQYYKTDKTNEARAMLKAQSIEELDEHELLDLLENPNDYQSRIELMEQFWYNHEFGDGYIIALNDSDGPGAESRNFKPTRLYAPNRDRVMPQRSNDKFNPIAYYLITLHNGEQLSLFPDQVFHMRKWNPNYNDLFGWSFVNSAGKTISKNEENQTAQGAAFVNGGRGVLFSSDSDKDGVGNVVDKMSGEQMSALKETMQRDYAGSMNNRRMHFTNGFVDVQSYGDTLAEMELIDSEKADWRDIYAVLGIPEALCPGSKESGLANKEVSYKELVTNTIVPELQKFDLKFKHWISRWYGKDIVASHDLTEFKELSPDLKLLSEVYGKPSLTEDERRALFNFDELGGDIGKAILVPSGLMPLEQLLTPLDEGLEEDGKQYDYR